MVLRRPPRRARRSIPITIPAPVGGLNNRDGLASMEPMDAFVMDNWFPGSTTVDTRNGHSSFSTGLAGAVESLEVYTGANGIAMLAFANGSVYDVTAGGAVGAAIATAKTSNKITSVMFSNAGNQYLIGLSGADAPFSYDGTTFNTLAITGVTGGQDILNVIHTFKGRILLAAPNQLGFYYLAVGAIQGAASYFDLSQQCKRGGYIAGIASISHDAGNGPDDYVVFMTSEGEYLVYGGTDPSSASAFALVGRYYAGAPIGRKGWFNYRSDLYIITAEGIISFTEIRSQGESQTDRKFLTAKLGRAYTDLTLYKATHGWDAQLYPRGGMLVVNVPGSGSTAGVYYQFVMNTTTNAWCRFTGQNGICWAVMDDRLYFGMTDGTIMKADEGVLDNGEQINCDIRQAYNYFDDGSNMGSFDKQFHFATFIVQSDGQPPVAAELNVNFEDDQPQSVGSLSGSNGGIWDVSEWDLAEWAGSGVTQNFTVPLGKIGYVGSIWLRAAITEASVRWYATRVICEKSAGLVII